MPDSHPTAPTTPPVYADDLTVGEKIDLGSYQVTEAEVIDFGIAWDPLDIHTDPAAAEDSIFGGLIASGLHTMAVYQRLAAMAVFRNWATIAGKRISDVNFLRPVRPGDTLTGTAEIIGIDFDDRGRALVTTTSALTNQDDKSVLGITVEVVVAMRPAA